MAGGKVVEFTKENWSQEVENSDIPVVVDFWAPWCGPCKLLTPVMDKLAEKYDGRVKVGKLNIDNANDIAVQHQITSIPRVFVFKGGEPVQKIIGPASENELSKVIDQVLAS